MYDEIRAAVDLCYRDGLLKYVVVENLSKYIMKDVDLVFLLKVLWVSGK